VASLQDEAFFFVFELDARDVEFAHGLHELSQAFEIDLHRYLLYPKGFGGWLYRG
jgi:hypothetical protein